jgi:hypothetical protein
MIRGISAGAPEMVVAVPPPHLAKLCFARCGGGRAPAALGCMLGDNP